LILTGFFGFAATTGSSTIFTGVVVILTAACSYTNFTGVIIFTAT
jgi:hypothetical protein